MIQQVRKLMTVVLLIVSVLTAARICVARAAVNRSTQATAAASNPVAAAHQQALLSKTLRYSAEPIPKETAGPDLISLGTFAVTAYCPCPTCCGIWSAEHPCRIGTDFEQRTYSGTIPTAGRTIGVDPTVIPLGTVVYIDGHPYVAEDTGSAIKGKIVDIFFPSHEEAVEWGVQYFEIFVPDNSEALPDTNTLQTRRDLYA